MSEEEDRLKAFEKRMAERKKDEAIREADKATQLANDYLKRTGRTETRP